MGEQGPEPSEYKKDYPDAIEDPIKAELVGHATKSLEEDVVKQGHTARNKMAKLGEPGNESDMKQRRDDATEALGRAQASRQKADQLAADVGELYDKTVDLNSGKSPEEPN